MTEPPSELWPLVRTVAINVLAKIQVCTQEDRKMPTRYRDRAFDKHDTGTFRKVTEVNSKIPSYSALFSTEVRDYGEARYKYSELNGFDALRDFIDHDERLVKFLRRDDLESNWAESLYLHSIAEIPMAVVTGALESRAFTDVTDDVLLEIYKPLEVWLVSEELLVETVMPISAVSFEEDRIDLPNGVYVERMTDGFQLARWPFWRIGLEFDNVLACSTHALVIPGPTLVNDSSWNYLRTASDEYRTEDIDQFFQALSVVTPKESGYAQVIYRPIGWRGDYKQSFPYIVPGPVVHRYPTYLERGLSEPTAILNHAECTKLQGTMRALRSTSPRTKLAARRLYVAATREDEQDSILDLCIGLEALIGDESPGDTTYKLAVRSTGALRTHLTIDPTEIYKAIKGIYAFRSAVVHGKKEATKKKQIQLADGSYDAIEAASFFLRRLLDIFLSDPSMNVARIDEDLLRGTDLHVLTSEDDSSDSADD